MGQPDISFYILSSHSDSQISSLCSNVITDPSGRYFLVTGLLNNTPVILANVYGPNWDNDSFFSNWCSPNDLT